MGYETTRITEGVWCIKDTFVQCFLIEGADRALLFDCCASGGIEFKQAVEAITTKPVQLLISHSDSDHTAGQEYFGTTYMHASEMSRYALRGNDPLRARVVWEGEVIDLGGQQLEVLLLPGHTPGSIALLDRKNRRLFAGDNISDGWIYIFGEGRSLEAFIISNIKLQKLSALFDNIYCCHGSMVLPTQWVAKTGAAARKLLAGELNSAEPPIPIEAKSYKHDGVVFFM